MCIFINIYYLIIMEELNYYIHRELRDLIISFSCWVVSVRLGRAESFWFL